MNKNEIFAHFSSILDTMLDTSLYFDTFFQRPFSLPEDIEGSIDDEAVPENLSIHFGASRGCIVDNAYDYVVKFDVEEDNEGCVCEREYHIYQHAKEMGVADYFAESIYLGTYVKKIMFYDCSSVNYYVDNYYYDPECYEKSFMEHEDEFGSIHEIVISIPLYAYPKAKHHYPSCVGNDEEICKTAARKIMSPLRENLSVAIEFIHEYGEEAYHTITDFLYNENVNDIHFGNVGNIGDRYVIIDYAGYHCGDSYYDDKSEEEESY